MVKIPFASTPWETFSCALDGTTYQFTTNYNERNGVWSFDLYDDATGAPLALGVAILIGCDLLAPYGLGIGSMYAIDMAATTAPALLGTTGTVVPVLQMTDADPLGAFNDDLGNRVIVVYLAPNEAFAT